MKKGKKNGLEIWENEIYGRRTSGTGRQRHGISSADTAKQS